MNAWCQSGALILSKSKNMSSMTSYITRVSMASTEHMSEQTYPSLKQRYSEAINQGSYGELILYAEIHES